MPCDTVNNIEFDLKNVPASMIEAVLKAMNLTGTVDFFEGQIEGHYVTGSIRAGRVWLDGSRRMTYDEKEISKAFHRGYTLAMLQKNAKTKGWQLKETGKNKYQIIKR